MNPILGRAYRIGMVGFWSWASIANVIGWPLFPGAIVQGHIWLLFSGFFLVLSLGMVAWCKP